MKNNETVEDFACSIIATLAGYGLVIYGFYWVIVTFILPGVAYFIAAICGAGLLLGGAVSIYNFFQACYHNISLKNVKVKE